MQNLLSTKDLCEILGVTKETIRYRKNCKNDYIKIPPPLTIARKQYWKKETVKRLKKNQDMYEKMCLSPDNIETQKLQKITQYVENERDLEITLIKNGYIYLSSIIRSVIDFVAVDGVKITVKRNLTLKEQVNTKIFNGEKLTYHETTSKKLNYISRVHKNKLIKKLENLKETKIKIKIFNRPFKIYKLEDVLRVCKVSLETQGSKRNLISSMLELVEITGISQEDLMGYADLQSFPKPVLLANEKNHDSFWETHEVLNWLKINNAII